MASGRIRIGSVGPGAYTLSAENGIYNLTGQAANLLKSGGEFSSPDVTGDFSDRSSITVSWDGSNGFGSTGPTVVHYDPLDAGADGASVQLSDPLIGGNYLQVNNNPKYSSEFSFFGTRSMMIYDYRENGLQRQTRKNFSAHPVFKVRYRMFVPDGGALPDRAIGGYTSARSSFKIAWIAYDQNSFGNGAPPDLCLPTFYGSQNMAISGNSGMPAEWLKYPGNNNTNIQDVFDYGEWWLVEVFCNPNTGFQRVRHMTETKGMMEFERTVAGGIDGFFGTETPQSFGTCNLTGYIRDETDEDPFDQCRVYVNDYAIYNGNGAGCDIVLGNAPVWADVTDTVTVIPTAWANTQVTGTVYKGNKDITGWHLFVLDDEGLPVTYDTGESRPIF